MSRVGKKPIEVPEGVEIRIDDGRVIVKGPKGELSHRINPRIKVEIKDRQVNFYRPTDRAKDKAFHGLTRSLVAGAVEGVSKGFEKTLEIVGVGYRFQVDGRVLTLNLGYSQPVTYPIPEGIEIEAGQRNQLVVKGIDKQLVGHVAATIRSKRPPEPYKGKGVRYADERIRRKVGKTGAA
jgi:large subunit ribosomal protein L6